MKDFRFKKALPIYFGEGQNDEFSDYRAAFRADKKSGKYILDISADSDYVVSINGRVAAFGQYMFYPPRYSVDTVDVTGYVADGENTVDVTVWYHGEGSFVYKPGKPFLCFEITSGKDVVCFSSEKTDARAGAGYVPYKREFITGQLGFNYHYDAADAGKPYEKAARVDYPELSFVVRPVAKLTPEDPAREFAEGKLVKRGNFKITDKSDENAARVMQNAEFCDGEPADGSYAVYDLGRETTGMLSFSIKTDKPCHLLIGYGEHIADGRCRTRVGKRNFAFDYYASAGENEFTGYFRRLACRYIQIFAVGADFTASRVGLLTTVYPAKIKKPAFSLGSELREKIYAASVRTLLCCMHEHYEDGPWREQALYTLDSRNQMLCGYYAFENGNRDFVRASLELIANGQRDDGLLAICYPAGQDRPIPFYSLVYIIQVKEYLDFTGDTSLIPIALPVIERIVDVFKAKINDRGTCDNFTGEGKGYWDFYEWSPTMAGVLPDGTTDSEAPETAVFAIALQNLVSIYDAAPENDASGAKRKECRKLAGELCRALKADFYDGDKKLFASFKNRDNGTFSVLTNALCVLCGAADALDESAKAYIKKIISENGEAGNEKIVPSTLSMDCFRYDALLSIDENSRTDIIADIDKKYGYMLEKGATTFWETIKGEADFEGAGSLCHGWSVMAVYYYNKFLG